MTLVNDSFDRGSTIILLELIQKSVDKIDLHILDANYGKARQETLALASLLQYKIETAKSRQLELRINGT